MRHQKEILQRIKEIENEDFLGFQTSNLIKYLDYENAKPFLKDGVTKEEWRKANRKSPKEQMIEYMSFAWEKANNFRGLSANIAMDYYMAWLWLDGDEKIWPTLKEYQYYGKDHLITICKYLGLDHTRWDDGIRSNTEES